MICLIEKYCRLWFSESFLHFHMLWSAKDRNVMRGEGGGSFQFNNNSNTRVPYMIFFLDALASLERVLSLTPSFPPSGF